MKHAETMARPRNGPLCPHVGRVGAVAGAGHSRRYPGIVASFGQLWGWTPGAASASSPNGWPRLWDLAGGVTGLDVSPAFLAYAEELAEQAGLAGRISFQSGDVKKDTSFDDNSFDWAWSADCVGYAPGTAAIVKRSWREWLRSRAARWSSWPGRLKLLPGYPLLEAHLGATSCVGRALCQRQATQFGLYARAGLVSRANLREPTARTFAGGLGPFTAQLPQRPVSVFQMRWAGAEPELTPEDRAAYRRLCLPDSPGFYL